MDTSEVKKLIEAFYNGETTLEEENLLYDYFKGDNIANELLDEQQIFLEMYNSEEVEVPKDLEMKLTNLIDDLASKEENIKTSKKRNLFVWATSIAAGIAILIFAGIHFNNQQPSVQPTMANVSAEEQLKIEEAQKALLLLSSNFNKGVNQLSVVSTSIDKTNEVLSRTLDQ